MIKRLYFTLLIIGIIPILIIVIVTLLPYWLITGKWSDTLMEKYLTYTFEQLQ